LRFARCQRFWTNGCGDWWRLPRASAKAGATEFRFDAKAQAEKTAVEKNSGLREKLDPAGGPGNARDPEFSPSLDLQERTRAGGGTTARGSCHQLSNGGGTAAWVSRWYRLTPKRKNWWVILRIRGANGIRRADPSRCGFTTSQFVSRRPRFATRYGRSASGIPPGIPSTSFRRSAPMSSSPSERAFTREISQGRSNAERDHAGPATLCFDGRADPGGRTSEEITVTNFKNKF
jgi:hypothetical protein